MSANPVSAVGRQGAQAPAAVPLKAGVGLFPWVLGFPAPALSLERCPPPRRVPEAAAPRAVPGSGPAAWLPGPLSPAAPGFGFGFGVEASAGGLSHLLGDLFPSSLCSPIPRGRKGVAAGSGG